MEANVEHRLNGFEGVVFGLLVRDRPLNAAEIKELEEPVRLLYLALVIKGARYWEQQMCTYHPQWARTTHALTSCISMVVYDGSVGDAIEWAEHMFAQPWCVSIEGMWGTNPVRYARIESPSIERLLHALIGYYNGSTVIVIEHNLDVIAQADWVIDMGPGAGHEGGEIVFEETPAAMKHDKHSVTGAYL